MQLNIQLDPSKSTLFLDLLAILKKDKMINDFQIVHPKSDKNPLNSYEKNLLDDLSSFADSIKSADNGEGIDTHRRVTIDLK